MNKHTNALGGAYVTPVLKTVLVQTQVGFAASPEMTAGFTVLTEQGDYEW